MSAAGDDGAVLHDDPFFLTRGVVLLPGDIATWDWPRAAKAAGLTTIATHTARHGGLGELASFLEADEGQAFVETCRRLGIHVEHELHAVADLLPRTLFDKDPTMFRMNDEGQRTPDHNLCVHSGNALEVVCENAVACAAAVRPTTGRYFYWIDDGKAMCCCPSCRGLSDSDQALILENAILAALRRADPDATLAHLAYHGTLGPPTQVKPQPGIFLEFAPIRRRYDQPVGLQTAHTDALEANLEVFGPQGAQVLEYWLDVSRFSGWKREKKARLPWRPDVFLEDLGAYAALGVRHVTSFACWVDGDYVERFGDPPLGDYAAGMAQWSVQDGRPARRSSSA